MLADFGLSRALVYSDPNMKTVSHNAKGTFPWMAYELAQILLGITESEFICNEASDMWAYGMVLYVSPWLSVAALAVI